MSRPKLGTTVETPWATGNYGAGPAWGGTPKRKAPPFTELTPDGGAVAQHANFLWGDLGDGLRANRLMQGQEPALSLPIGVRGTTTNALKRAAWSQYDQIWAAVGDGATNYIEVTQDHGRTWTNLSGSMGAALVHLDAAFDSAGNLVILASGSRSIELGTRTGWGAWTFAAISNAVSANPSGGQLDFDTKSGRFIACYRNGVSGHKVDSTATPGAAWTPATLPAAWTSYTGTNSPVMGADGGTAVAAFADAGTSKINFIRSTDGGVTWSTNAQATSQALVNGYGGIEMSRPTFDASNGDWFVSVASTTVALSTEIFRSSDGGVTWTSVFYRDGGSLSMQEIQALGGLLTGANLDGRIFYSVARGSTWQSAGRVTGTTTRVSLRAGGGGLIYLNSADKITMASNRFGDPGRSL